MKRTLAWIGIIAILIVFASLVYCAVTGASAGTIMAFMFCLIMIPVVIHAMILFTKMGNKEEKDRE